MPIAGEITRDDALKAFLEADEAWRIAQEATRAASRSETAARNRESEAFKTRQKAEEVFVRLFKIGAKS